MQRENINNPKSVEAMGSFNYTYFKKELQILMSSLVNPLKHQQEITIYAILSKEIKIQDNFPYCNTTVQQNYLKQRPENILYIVCV